MRIAIQGELGSFSHEAAEAMVPQAKVVPCARSLEVFDRVRRGTVDGAVIPIENSLAGSVAEHFDLLLGREVHIIREFRLRIVHNLIALPGTKLRDVRRVFSHPVALDQCRDLFAKNPKLEPVPFYDTAGSVKHLVAEGLRDAAGIASRRAAGQPRKDAHSRSATRHELKRATVSRAGQLRRDLLQCRCSSRTPWNPLIWKSHPATRHS